MRFFLKILATFAASALLFLLIFAAALVAFAPSTPSWMPRLSPEASIFAIILCAALIFLLVFFSPRFRAGRSLRRKKAAPASFSAPIDASGAAPSCGKGEESGFQGGVYVYFAGRGFEGLMARGKLAEGGLPSVKRSGPLFVIDSAASLSLEGSDSEFKALVDSVLS